MLSRLDHTDVKSCIFVGFVVVKGEASFLAQKVEGFLRGGREACAGSDPGPAGGDMWFRRQGAGGNTEVCEHEQNEHTSSHFHENDKSFLLQPSLFCP